MHFISKIHTLSINNNSIQSYLERLFPNSYTKQKCISMEKASESKITLASLIYFVTFFKKAHSSYL